MTAITPTQARAQQVATEPITNIPTDLLRTLVTVVDLRSFTRAANMLGVTQPAVSAQIKRLQFLLGADLLDKSAPGVSLTPAGEVVVNYARRLLSINDQILDLAGPRPKSATVRVGVPSDIFGPALARSLGGFRTRWPEVRFTLRSGGHELLLRELRQGELDVVLAVSASNPILDARHYWTEQLSWVRGPLEQVGTINPVPFVSYGEECAFYRIAQAALTQVGQSCDVVFTAPSLAHLIGAVASGLGLMVLPRSRVPNQLVMWDDGPLPPLPAMFCGIFVREGGDRELFGQLAETMAAALNSSQEARPQSVT
jgi:DNA-binding transcriptional LysR family regulator